MRSVITPVLCVLILEFSIVSLTPRSGVYIDNGYDQTSIEHLMTEKEKKEMEVEILNLLGLPHRPRKVNKSPLKKSAPRFLLDIYKSLLVKDDDDENFRSKRSTDDVDDDINLSGEEQQQIDESDVIMTFESVSKYKNMYLLHLHLMYSIVINYYLLDKFSRNVKYFINFTSTKKIIRFEQG